MDSPKLIISYQFWNILTTFDAFPPYLKIQKLGWEINDFFPLEYHCQKLPWEIFDFALSLPPIRKFSQVIPCD